MKQLSLIPKKRKTEHGGVFAVGRRRSKRPMEIKKPLHVTLRSPLAVGRRSLMKNHNLVERIIKKASRRFHIRIYEKAICGNHIHLAVKGRTRFELQNFFRVVAGHVAQEILQLYPLQKHERGGAPGRLKGHPKNRRKFWGLLLYSRIVSWGRDFETVKRYIIQNVKESLGLIPYQARKKSRFQSAAGDGDSS